MSKLELSELRNYLLINLGLKFGLNQEKDLYRRITKASDSFNFDDVDSFINWLVNQPLNDEQTKHLASFLTIGETYFFREKKTLNYLEFIYLPKLIKKRHRNRNTKKLKIWSAGCSSGEEPYSIAILLKRVIPDIKNWDITILGTDINPKSIEKAKRGIYSEWSFRGLPEYIKTAHFKKLEYNKFSIHKEIQEMVTFSSLNLIADSFPSRENKTNDIDVILCRNVFIYFSQVGINSVISKFSNSLVKGGLIIVSPVEVSYVNSPMLNPVSYNGTTIFIKEQKIISKKAHVNYDGAYDFGIVNTIHPLPQDLIPKKEIKLPVVQTVDKKIIERIQMPSAIKSTPKKKTFEKSNYEKILSLYKSGLIDEAEQQVEETIGNGINNKETYYLLLARIKADKGKLEASEKLCLQAIKLNKVSTESHYLLSTILNEQGKTNEAIRSLNSTIFLDPDFALGHFLLGNISLKTGKRTEQKKHFQNALRSLNKLSPEKILDEQNGLTAGRLSEIINSIG